VLALDVPRGVYIPPAGPVRWRLRNPSSLPLRAEHWHGQRHLFDVELAPESVATVSLTPTQRSTLLPDGDPSVTLTVQVHDPRVDSSDTPVSTSAVMLLQRDGADPLPPAAGDHFSATVTLADAHAGSYTVPGGRRGALACDTP